MPRNTNLRGALENSMESLKTVVEMHKDVLDLINNDSTTMSGFSTIKEILNGLREIADTLEKELEPYGRWIK